MSRRTTPRARRGRMSARWSALNDRRDPSERVGVGRLVVPVPRLGRGCDCSSTSAAARSSAPTRRCFTAHRPCPAARDPLFSRAIETASCRISTSIVFLPSSRSSSRMRARSCLTSLEPLAPWPSALLGGIAHTRFQLNKRARSDAIPPGDDGDRASRPCAFIQQRALLLGATRAQRCRATDPPRISG